MEYGEKFNTYSHLAGALLALVGSVVLGAFSGDVWKIVSFAIYGATLLLYSFSTLYHNAAHGKAKVLLQKLDHNAIYLLIAGSYTPFTLVSLREPWGWSLFGVVWGLALLGISREIWLKKKTRLKHDLYGLKFYYAKVLDKPWPGSDLVKPPKSFTLPDIITVPQAQQLFMATRVLSYRVFFFTLYSLGLRR